MAVARCLEGGACVADGCVILSHYTEKKRRSTLIWASIGECYYMGGTAPVVVPYTVRHTVRGDVLEVGRS